MTPGTDLVDSRWKLGAITAAWARQPMEQALEGVAETGVRYVEFASIPGYVDHFVPEHVGSGQVDAIRAVLDRVELGATSMSPGADLTTTAGAAPALGITYVNNGSGSDGSRDQNERFFANIAELAGLAERHDVIIAIYWQGRRPEREVVHIAP